MIANVLAERYASAAMQAIWSPAGRIVLEREFWIAVMKAQRELGLEIPAEAITAYEAVKERVDTDVGAWFEVRFKLIPEFRRLITNIPETLPITG